MPHALYWYILFHINMNNGTYFQYMFYYIFSGKIKYKMWLTRNNEDKGDLLL